MVIETWQDWVAWAGIVLPLGALAWSAVMFVQVRRDEEKQRKFSRVFQVMDSLGQPGGSVASKMAAACELRTFKDYAPVIVRLCEKVEVDGESAQMLRDELKLTADVMRSYT